MALDKVQPVPLVLGFSMRLPQNHRPLVIQIVVGVVQTVAALAQHRAAVGVPNGFSGGLHILRGVDLSPGKGLGFGNVGCHHCRQGKQLFLKGGCGGGLQQPGPAGGHHHRIHHNVFRLVVPQLFPDLFNQPYRGNHADLHRIGADVLKHCVDLLP